MYYHVPSSAPSIKFWWHASAVIRRADCARQHGARRTTQVQETDAIHSTQYTVESTRAHLHHKLECIILRMYYGTYHKYRITQLSYYCFANARSRYSCTTRAQKQNGDIRARLGLAWLAWLAWLALARDHSFVCSIVRIKVKTISPTLSAKFFLLTYL